MKKKKPLLRRNLIYYFSSHRIRISFLRKNNYLNGFGDTTPWEILRPSPFISGKFVKRSKRIHPIHNLLKRSGVSAIGLRTKLSSRGSVVRVPPANFLRKQSCIRLTTIFFSLPGKKQTNFLLSAYFFTAPFTNKQNYGNF